MQIFLYEKYLMGTNGLQENDICADDTTESRKVLKIMIALTWLCGPERLISGCIAQ
jgi:hypothetical protein